MAARRAGLRGLGAMALSAGVLSIIIGASLKRPSALDNFSQSSGPRRPVRNLCWSNLPTEPIIRNASCDEPISIEKTATGSFRFNATCSPMLSASDVLPIDGLPATTTRSPSCRPDVIRSRSV